MENMASMDCGKQRKNAIIMKHRLD